MSQILDGKSLSLKIKEELRKMIEERVSNGFKPPRLDIIMIGNDYATSLYVGIKKSLGQDIGVEVVVHDLDYAIETKDLIGKINEIENITDGILVQLPLPERIDTRKVLDSIPVHLDIDGLTTENLEKLKKNELGAIPSATALGVITLLKENNIELEGKRVCMIGNSIEVGQPLSAMLKNEGSIVTVCDIDTPNTKEISKESDIVISATGNPEMVTKEWIKKDAVVIDIGISRVGERIVGDVNYEDVKDQVSYISPVPGGVGPMTVVSLFRNLITTLKT
ncbi:bifunctional 5,10-methylenetetrahydrofolate dehydrogenase/5,10-methenyltetrahydrofolate cyclohydrolase [Candidatus Dojkabacteria bacterium]|nr:bifunctional 5,10-methylenetetrahydrofolate dehydrogenase/5,10-methenyltetrahydrofolate cyclohydrolase [Candidatus Dojkabacteria bacterium]